MHSSQVLLHFVFSLHFSLIPVQLDSGVKTYKWGVEDVEILARVRKHSHVSHLCMFPESIVINKLFQQKRLVYQNFALLKTGSVRICGD